MNNMFSFADYGWFYGQMALKTAGWLLYSICSK